MLVRAFRNKVAENRSFRPEGHEEGADLFDAEILCLRYGFPARDGLNPRKNPSSRIFQPSEIGKKRYHTAQSVVSRACWNLDFRRLVRRVRSDGSTWAGIVLTRSGARLARELQKADSIESAFF
jgi:hypothetical protein